MKIKVEEPKTGEYPYCMLCHNSLRRPCNLYFKDKKVLVCGGCFKIAMIIARMQSYGYIKLINEKALDVDIR